MLRLSVEDMLTHIHEELPFHAVAEDYSFELKVEKYVPLLGGAVHDGHQFRKSLWKYCLHSAYERWYEEDPCTKQMITDMPILISGNDSRFEYDLNRAPDSAIYEDAWGKKLWNTQLPDEERKLSLSKHANFYRVVHTLVQKLESKFEKVLVVDMHSYNKNRWEREVPTWNLGTSNIDNDRFGHIVEDWRKKLESMHYPAKIPRTAAVNDTFQGNGYFLKYITANFENSLVLATEIAKVYCDEETGIQYPEIVASVRRQLKELIPLQLQEFLYQ